VAGGWSHRCRAGGWLTMAKVLGLLNLVPCWVWAIAVAVLLAMCGALEVSRLSAKADASLARADLLAVQLASAHAISLERERARKEERRLSAAVLEVQDDLAKERAGSAGRVADLSERLRNVARPVSCRPAASRAPAAAGAGHGQPDLGLPGLAGADLVVLDGQALGELATFAESAADTGRTLTQARRLLRECWQSGAVPAGP